MATKTFDKDTILDLTVNMVPLAIILFFVVAFAVFPAFGTDRDFSGLQFAVIISRPGDRDLSYDAGEKRVPVARADELGQVGEEPRLERLEVHLPPRVRSDRPRPVVVKCKLDVSCVFVTVVAQESTL